MRVDEPGPEPIYPPVYEISWNTGGGVTGDGAEVTVGAGTPQRYKYWIIQHVKEDVYGFVPFTDILEAGAELCYDM